MEKCKALADGLDAELTDGEVIELGAELADYVIEVGRKGREL